MKQVKDIISQTLESQYHMELLHILAARRVIRRKKEDRLFLHKHMKKEEHFTSYAHEQERLFPHKHMKKEEHFTPYAHEQERLFPHKHKKKEDHFTSYAQGEERPFPYNQRRRKSSSK